MADLRCDKGSGAGRDECASKTTAVYLLAHHGFKYHVVKDSHEVPLTVHQIRVLFLQCYCFQSHILLLIC